MATELTECYRQALTTAGELWGDSAPAAYKEALARNQPFLLCSHPVSMTRTDMATLRSREYVVGDKTDGVRQFLLLGTHPGGGGGGGSMYTCVIDRKCTVTMLPSVRVKNLKLYQGTLIDGEFIAETATFVAFDIVAVCGMQAWKAPHTKRMGALHAVLPSIQTDGWTIVPKAWYPLSAMHRIPGLEGLIFVPVQESMRPGKCDTLFKWKAVHTIDFVLDDGQLYVFDKGHPVRVSPREFVLHDHHPEATTKGAVVIECRLEPHQPSWRVHIVKVRTDKSTPNDIKTLHATMRNVLEAIDRTELNANCAAMPRV
jgi:hypothetical protein